MNTPVVGKITERGQITLPHKIRESDAFANARAVIFVAEGDSVRITALKAPDQIEDRAAILNHTMKDWLDPAHDNLFDFS
jgi:bifunctional DNA-binding transcriptional regulator/antitoxin component of YhaV-PrlF toxin-antitoxin module